MNIVKSRAFRAIALLTLLITIGFNVWTRQAVSQPPAPPARVIPPEGITENDTSGKVPGDAKNAEDDFRKIYAAIGTHRGKHGGQYPADTGDILEALVGGLKSRDLEKLKRDVKEAHAVILNPDSKYSDDPVSRKQPDQSSEYNIRNKRPDGSVVGDPPSGKKDVLVETSLYCHQNVRTFPHQRSTNNPVGFYVVLWHDGTIQRIAYDKILYVPKGGGDFTRAFPGQAGVPDNALTYDEFYRAAGWIKGPRGEEGGKGSSFKGKAF